ncbi:MAG: ABC transporter permease [Phycisphaerae bacterium]|jgi:ribose transport system permease protein
MKKTAQKFLARQQSGLIIVILILGVILTTSAGSHIDRQTGRTVNNFFNSYTLMQTATDASFFAIMAVGATMVIIYGGIDLSVGSVYALCGVTTALLLRHLNMDSASAVILGIFVSLGLGLVCGLLNGLMVVGLEVHPFIITLGTMWIFRGVAFVMSKAESILVPGSLTAFAKANLGLNPALYPVAMLIMIGVTVIGAFYLSKTVMGRHIYAIGGNAEASRYAGLHVKRITVSVFAISGLTAGIAAFLGSAYYGSASCGDATGYELYVIASAVVGGASLSGGKGNAVSAMLGAILIILIRQSIRTLHFDQNFEWIIIGAATIIAVVLDKLNARLTLKRAMK